MSHAHDDDPVRSDGELIARVRAGDGEAYGELFARHRDAAARLARQLAGPGDADDLVSDAFSKVYNVLSRGGGPDLAFRAYLLTAVRRLHVDRIRAARMVVPTDEIEDRPDVPFDDPAVVRFDNAAAANAFRSLPERWQLVLWHLEVESQKPADVAPLLGMTPNGVSALGYRAREGLRQAYLQMHLAACADDECRWATERLGARVRNGLSRRDQRKVDEHLDGCRRCSGLLVELADVNSNFAGFLAPAVLGVAATGYLTTLGKASTGLGAHAGWPMVTASRHALNAHGLLATSGAAASVVAVATGAALFVNHLPGGQAVADPPALRNQVVAATSGTPTGAGHASAGHHAVRQSTRAAERPGHRLLAGHSPYTTPGQSGASLARGGTPTGFGPGGPRPTQPTHTHPTPPTSPPTSPPAGQVDISMSRSSAQGQSRTGELQAHLRVDAAPTAQVDVSVTFWLPEMTTLTVSAGPWRCDPWPPSPQVTEYTCTITAARPPVLNVHLTTVDHASPWIKAHATATGVVDPNLDDNWFSWHR